MSWDKVVKPVLKVVGPALIGAGASAYGSKKASDANTEASRIQAQSNADALAFAREQEARRQKEYDQQIAAEKAQWEAEQARLAPYRAASYGILGQAADRLGMSLGELGGAGGYSGSRAYSGPSSAGKDSGRRVDSLASLANGNVEGALTPETPAMEAPKLTLADIIRMKSAGDWRTGRTV